jgi:hypothetical protein
VRLLGRLAMGDAATPPGSGSVTPGASSAAGAAAVGGAALVPAELDAALQAAASGSSSPDNVPAAAPCILVYGASYISGLPYQGPVGVQLRECVTH